MEFTKEERAEISTQIALLREQLSPLLHPDDERKLRELLDNDQERHYMQGGVFGLNPLLFGLQTALIALEETGLKREGVLSIIIYSCRMTDQHSLEELGNMFGDGVARILHGLIRVQSLYKKSPTVESENFRNLLISFAEDMRVILIMIADRVNLMRQIRDTDMVEEKLRVSEEASYLYAPLAHKLGLYKLKAVHPSYRGEAP